MGSKFIVFVVFVILAQSSFVLQSHAYKLSIKTTATLVEISLNQEAALKATLDSFNNMFDMFNKLAAIQIWDLTAETNDYAFQVAKANARAKDAISYSSDAVLLVVGQNCSNFEKSGNSRDFNLYNVFSLVPIAVELATNGNFNGDGATIEDLRVSVEEKLANSIHSLYDAIRCCLNTEDEEVLAAIELAEVGTREGNIHTCNAIFNVMKIYAAAISANSADLALITAIEVGRSYASAALRASIAHTFSLYKALVINSDLGLYRAAFDLNSIECAETVSTYRWIAGVNIYYETLIASMTNVALGISYADNNDFAVIDAAEAKTAAEFMAGFQAIMDSILIVNPDTTTAVADASASLAIGSKELAATCYGALIVIQSEDITYDVAVDTIERLRNKLLIDILVIVSKVFELIQDEDTRDPEVEAEISFSQAATATAIRAYANDIFDTAQMFLKMKYGIADISEDDFTTVRILQSAAVPLIEYSAYNIAASRIAALIADLSGYVEIEPDSFSFYGTPFYRK